MLLPAIPNLVKNFEIAYNTSSWILTAYLITGAVMTPIAGRLSDVYGKKKVLTIIMAIYIMGTLLGGLSTNIIIMIFSRIIQGIGLAMFPVAFGIIREKFPEKKLAIGQGIFTAVFSGGAVVGLGLGATIVEHFGWRMTFLSIIPFAIILLVIIIKYIQVISEKLTSRIENSVMDIKGTLILIIMTSVFLIALTLLPNSTLDNRNNNLIFTGLLFSLSIALFPIFIAIEKRSRSPLINLQLLKDTILLPTNILILTIGISIFIIYQSLPILIQSPIPLGFGGSPVEAASVQLPFMVLSLIISISSGFLVSRIGNMKPTIFGSIISATGFFLIYIYHSTEFIISIDLSIIAIGLSLIEIGAFNIVLVYSPLHLSGSSLGITMLLFLIGMSVGPTISGIYLQSFQSSIKGINGSFPSTFSYNMIFLTAVLISISSIILTVLVTRKLKYEISNKNQY
jgi:MFS family permease